MKTHWNFEEVLQYLNEFSDKNMKYKKSGGNEMVLLLFSSWKKSGRWFIMQLSVLKVVKEKIIFHCIIESL